MQEKETARDNKVDRLTLLSPYGTFDTHFRSGDHYICDLPNLGPLLLSVIRENTITYVMVRSVLGWLTYSYEDDIIGSNSTTHPILVSLYRYFPDVIDGWSVSFSSRKQTYFNFFNIFGFNSFYPIKTEAKSCSKDESFYNFIKTKVLCNIDKYLLPQIVNRFAKISCFDVEAIENFTFSDIIRVNISKTTFNKLFPFAKILDTLKTEKISVTSFEITDEELGTFELKNKSSKGTLEKAIKEFLITEADYFILIDDLYYSDVIKIKEGQDASEIVFSEAFGEFKKIYKAEKSFVEDLYNQIKIVKEEEIKQINRLHPSRSFNRFNLLQEHEECEYSDSNLLKLFTKTLIKNSDGWSNYITFFLSYDLILDKIKEYSKKYKFFNFIEISDGFNHILQRLTRYPLLIRNILELCPAEIKSRRRLKRFYLQLVKFIRHMEDLRDQEDNYRILYKIDSILQIGITNENTRFVDQLDCQGEEGSGFTFFILSNVTILAQRVGDPRPILSSSAKYTKLNVFQNKDINFHPRGTTGIYLLVNHSIQSTCFTETYKDCSLSIRYFVSYNQNIRNRFIKNFYDKTVFFAHDKLFFTETGAEYAVETISDEDLTPNKANIYTINKEYGVLKSQGKIASLVSFILSQIVQKIIYFYKDDVLIKMGQTVYYASALRIEENPLQKLYDLLKTLNHTYLEIERKISLSQHIEGYYTKPFSKGDKNIDIVSLLGPLTSKEALNNIVICFEESTSAYSLFNLSKPIEPLCFLKSKFIMQEIVEFNSNRKLTEFDEAGLFSNLTDYVPKQVEILIKKIIENEDYAKLHNTIFKSTEDVHHLIMNYLATNIYCYFTRDDLIILKTGLKGGESLHDVPILSNRTFYKLLLSYFSFISQMGRSLAIYNFFKRIFPHNELTHEEIARITRPFSS